MTELVDAANDIMEFVLASDEKVRIILMVVQNRLRLSSHRGVRKHHVRVRHEWHRPSGTDFPRLEGTAKYMSTHTVDDLQLSVTEKGNIESIPMRSASSTAVVKKAIQATQNNSFACVSLPTTQRPYT